MIFVHEKQPVVSFCGECRKEQMQYAVQPDSNCVNASGRNVFAHTLTGPPKIIIFVISKPKRHKYRQRIRDTWGSTESQNRNKIRVNFLLGISGLNKGNNDSVSSESSVFGDILAVNITNENLNNSLLFMEALRWAVTNCSKAEFVLKVEDDAKVHLSDLLRGLHLLKPRKLGGKCSKDDSVVRKDNSSSGQQNVFKFGLHLPSCDRSLYIMHLDTASSIYNEFLKTPYNTKEELLLGYILQKLKIPTVNVPGFYDDKTTSSIDKTITWMLMISSVIIILCFCATRFHCKNT